MCECGELRRSDGTSLSGLKHQGMEKGRVKILESKVGGRPLTVTTISQEGLYAILEKANDGGKSLYPRCNCRNLLRGYIALRRAQHQCYHLPDLLKFPSSADLGIKKLSRRDLPSSFTHRTFLPAPPGFDPAAHHQHHPASNPLERGIHESNSCNCT